MRKSFFMLSLLLSSWASAAWNVDTQKIPQNLKAPLLEKFPELEKQRISKEQMDEIIKWLHSSVEVDKVLFLEESATTARLEIQRIQRIGEITFTGLSAITESEARNYISFNRNDPYDEATLLESGERLRQAYKDLGYLNAEIDVEMPTNEKGQLILNVKIKENTRTEITKIFVETPITELRATLEKAVRSYKGKGFTDFTLNDISQTLKEALNADSRYLTEVVGPEARFNADETQVELVFRVNKTDRFQIDFRGYQVLTKKKLEELLDLENYNSSNPNIITELTQKIKNEYLSLGYARVEVQAEEREPTGPYNRSILFLIDEGSRIEIERYVISGKYSRDPEYYAEFIRKNSSDLIKKGIYNKDEMEIGFTNLITHLRNQGHLLAKIVSTRTQNNRAKDKVTIFINIDEGPVTRVNKIQFLGNSAFSSEQLLEVLELEQREPLRLNQLEKAIQDLKNYYYENGYIEMILLNEKEDLVSYNEDNTLAQLNFKLFEGPQVRVGSIVLDGNHFTKDYVILNEIDLTVGETVTPEKMEESISRLQRVGHFNSVEIKTLEEKTNVSQRTVIVRVTERDPGVFTMGLGATNERQLTLRGYTGIAYRNILGTGRAASLRLEGNYNVADVKYLENKVTFGYLEPYLFNTRLRGRLNLSRSKTVTDYEYRLGTEVNQTTTSIEKDFTTHVLGVWDISVATFKDFSVDNQTQIDENLINIASTGPTIDIDYRDNIFNPSKGTFTRLSAEYASPELGSTETIRYWRGTGTFNHYVTVAPGPWVIANSWRVGYMENLSNLTNGGVPYDHKGFILGGRSTIRGYESGTSEVFPNRSDLGLDDANDKYTMKTRAKMGLIKSEIRFPILGNLGGALFYDGGYVEIEGLRFEDYYRDSVGFGLRYNTPVGPLNLEFGWKLDRRVDEETGRFHLSIGAF